MDGKQHVSSNKLKFQWASSQLQYSTAILEPFDSIKIDSITAP